jgi:hypothetical protein
MDASPTPRQTLRLLVEIHRSPDRRLEGQVRTNAPDPWRPFSGVLELLKVLEELVESRDFVLPEHGNPTETRKETT